MQERKSAFWMMQVDEKILEYLNSEGWGTPSVMARSRGFHVSEGMIRERCQMLRYAGFVEAITSSMYDITTDGTLYLRGELDASNRPKPTAERVLRE
ncbi:hypothetical protein [Haloarcula laminariae]|uniref:hypothetical protein n=1 Tax=Haloarcula laminariae TaxID=2961577 RepID=UPI002404F979|nr:hypothetical protein [Halomicroarcula sp. FL173]